MIKRTVTIELDGKDVSMDEITYLDYKFVLNDFVRLDIVTKSQGSFHFESKWDNQNEFKKIVMMKAIIANHTSGPIPATE